MLIISLFLPFVPKGKSVIISALLKSPLGDLGAEKNNRHSTYNDIKAWLQHVPLTNPTNNQQITTPSLYSYQIVKKVLQVATN